MATIVREENNNIQDGIYNLTKENTTVKDVAEICKRINPKMNIVKKFPINKNFNDFSDIYLKFNSIVFVSKTLEILSYLDVMTFISCVNLSFVLVNSSTL